jgi:hypothetical protein
MRRETGSLEGGSAQRGERGAYPRVLTGSQGLDGSLAMQVRVGSLNPGAERDGVTAEGARQRRYRRKGQRRLGEAELPFGQAPAATVLEGNQLARPNSSLNLLRWPRENLGRAIDGDCLLREGLCLGGGQFLLEQVNRGLFSVYIGQLVVTPTSWVLYTSRLGWNGGKGGVG